ncbi:MAG: hypothetical protein J6X55_03430, partial [Victivallales bacterium]|nr:hypothetical protein [Victivallales bacterium]
MDDIYELLDSGYGRKLERFGEITLDRPCAQAVWRPQLDASAWQKANAVFHREAKNAFWERHTRVPESWRCQVGNIVFRLQLTDFGHVGVFPENVLCG